jgi:2-haloacid dehalogenase
VAALTSAPTQAPAQRPPLAVLFDLGGVFLDWDPRYLYRKLFGEDVAAMEDFLANVCTPAWHSEQDRGQSIAEACAERRAKFPQYAELIDAWGERSEEMINGVIDGSVQIFADIKQAGVPCYALSNMERENWERRYETYDFLRWFDGYFISGLEGVIKPDPEYFELALERFKFEPQDVFFIDDRTENVDAARTLGIPSIVFRSPETLRAELVDRGLLAADRPLAQSGGGASQDLPEDPGRRGEI